MKIEVNISKKYLFFILGAFLLLAGIFAVYAFQAGGLSGTFGKTKEQAVNFGHSADEVVVDISGTKMTLQDAIAQGKIGGVSTGVASGGFSNFAVFDYASGKDSNGNTLTPSSSGQYTWSVPSGVSKIMVEAWGGGGGGASPSGAYISCFLDGGGGAYGKGVFSVGSGTYTVSVGKGGTTPATNDGTSPSDGGSSSLISGSGTLMSVEGGKNGVGGFGVGSGAGGTSVSGAQISIAGMSSFLVGNGNPVGGFGANGGAGAVQGEASRPPRNAIVPGGGGGCEYGQNGAHGRVVIWW